MTRRFFKTNMLDWKMYVLIHFPENYHFFPFYNIIPYFHIVLVIWKHKHTHTHTHSIFPANPFREWATIPTHWSPWRRIHLGRHEKRNFIAWLATMHNPITAHINSNLELCRLDDLSRQPRCWAVSPLFGSDRYRFACRSSQHRDAWNSTHFKMPGQSMLP